MLIFWFYIILFTTTWPHTWQTRHYSCIERRIGVTMFGQEKHARAQLNLFDTAVHVWWVATDVGGSRVVDTGHQSNVLGQQHQADQKSKRQKYIQWQIPWLTTATQTWKACRRAHKLKYGHDSKRFILCFFSLFYH